MTAATVSVKVGAMLKEELKIDNIKDVYWTDSKIVLGYISNESRRFRVYVANRVQMIRSHTEKRQWMFVPTDENPADFVSRGLQFNSKDVHKWFNGPAFLWKKDYCEGLLEESHVISDSDPELVRAKAVNVYTISTSEDEHNILKSLQNNVSCWYRLKRIVAMIKLFGDLCRKKPSMNSSNSEVNISGDYLTVNLIEEAELLIIRWLQAVHFKKELMMLKKITSDSTDRASLRCRKALLKGCNISQLDSFLDKNGILRVGGRLKKSNFDINQKFPILLPKNSQVTSLIICWFHNLVEHRGRHITLNEIRGNGYWIVHGSSRVQQYISKCVRCRFLRGRLGIQKMANLPVDMTTSEAPFVYCGVDAFGPFYVKEGRNEMKRYGVLFTCFCSRAVHI